MVNYQQGKIYKIVNSVNDVVYVGSTCEPLSRRMANHRAQAKFKPGGALHRAMIELGSDKFRIILVEDYPCSSKSHLEAREFQITSDLKRAGTELYNLLIDGKLSIPRSEETRKKMSENSGMLGKTGAAHGRFKCGSVSFNSKKSHWMFQWYENLKKTSKYFSVKKYGAEAAHGLVLAFQDEIYPKEPEDDSEFICELKQKINS